MAPLPARGPSLERWWERDVDVEVAAALGLSADMSEEAVAGRFRGLAGLSPEGSTDPGLWTRFHYGVELARTGPLGPRGDTAELANNVVEWAIVPPGDREEARYGLAAWERELHAPKPNADEALRELVMDEIAPRLERAGLYALL